MIYTESEQILYNIIMKRLEKLFLSENTEIDLLAEEDMDNLDDDLYNDDYYDDEDD